MFERENRTERFYDLDDGSEDAVVAGVKCILGYAEEHGHGEAVIVVATLASVDNLAARIGSNRARSLQKNGRVRIREVTLRLGTRREPGAGRDTPVVAVWPDDDLLAKLDDRQPPAICAVASSGEYIPQWLANWRPKPVRPETTPLPEAVPAVSPVLEAALDDLTTSINCGTGLTDPDDKGLAVAILRAFDAGDEPYDPTAARVWAVNHGWTAAGAQQLQQVAQEVRDGVRHRTTRKLPADILDRYREKASSGP